MRVLVACEYSGRTRDAFRLLGHDAWSCDLLACENNQKFHYQCDVREILNEHWDLMIAHPDCTFLCSSGMHWTTRGLRDQKLTDDALEFVQLLMDAPIPRIAIENPVGRIGTAIRKHDQIIQPYEYGDDASKRTCLWLKGLSLLRPTKRVQGRLVQHNGKTVERWSNQTDSGQNKLGPSADRWKDRSRTYQGWSNAMAMQWGGLVMGGKTYHDWNQVVADFDAELELECEL